MKPVTNAGPAASFLYSGPEGKALNHMNIQTKRNAPSGALLNPKHKEQNMFTAVTDLRRLFRNRFELFRDASDNSGANVNDGSSLTLRDLCGILAEDAEEFPRHYDEDIKDLCKHQFRYWLRDPRTYGDVARLVLAQLDVSDGSREPLTGIWLPALLDRQVGSSNPLVSEQV